MTTVDQGGAPAAAAQPAPAGPSAHDLYAEANRLNAKLASSTDANLIREGQRVAKQLLDHVASKVSDFEDFKRRVYLSEEFSLTESRQVPKTERELKVFYLRATSLQEAAAEAEERARKKKR